MLIFQGVSWTVSLHTFFFTNSFRRTGLDRFYHFLATRMFSGGKIVGSNISWIHPGEAAGKPPAGTAAARTVPPEDMTPTDLADLASAEVATNPAKAGGNWQPVTGGAYRVTYKTPATQFIFGSFIGVTVILYRIFGAWNITELYMGVSKIKWYTKMDGENNGKPYENGMIWGESPLFLETSI